MAAKELETMIDMAENKAEAHYNKAKLIYDYNLSLGDKKPYADWTLEQALNEIRTALVIFTGRTILPSTGRHLFCYAEL